VRKISCCTFAAGRKRHCRSEKTLPRRRADVLGKWEDLPGRKIVWPVWEAQKTSCCTFAAGRKRHCRGVGFGFKGKVGTPAGAEKVKGSILVDH